jgi:hypothetical protein
MEWLDFCAGRLPDKGTRPQDIPKQPNNTYADQGWLGYGDWLGTGSIASFKRQFKTFAEAREYARSLKLESRKQWEVFCKGGLPVDIPKTPHLVYAEKGWRGYEDWLGVG